MRARGQGIYIAGVHLCDSSAGPVLLNQWPALGAPAPKVPGDSDGGWTLSQCQDYRILMENACVYGVSEPRAQRRPSVNTLSEYAWCPRLPPASVLCGGPISW